MEQILEYSDTSFPCGPFVIDQTAYTPRRREATKGLTQSAVGPVNTVRPALRHIGCMWLDDGDENRRCGRQVAWTVGISLAWPRVYCEKHGRLIMDRHDQEIVRRELGRMRKVSQRRPIERIADSGRVLQPA
ncbi:MAG: hypothetical protein KJ970_17735 [Candidatus Eisenbacteria bacterium]|uniref:Uncharacterized protein n=1 Tax=Eiseniibacteriota bacterium TaxID=2212470 RepID=A0A948S005_UNCEI|nr:hypothetical protein [Candidatus Eisenbacteria bacterium]MBU1949946.1 hypothetical protein [Candidatus Eisenbacteria bacterium]MBU2692762.1 hypothetical protein [Candidatus Eisenbacteria bacterium]